MKTNNYDQVIQNISNWGFNTGCYQGPKWMWEKYPYTKGINFLEIRNYLSKDRFEFKDVFDENFLRDLESRIEQIVKPQANNKLLIGYFSTDMPVWSMRIHGQDWISFYKQLPKSAPGYQKWIDWRQANPQAAEEEFLGLIAQQLYAKAYGFIRKYDPNHLIFSDRFSELDAPEVVIQKALPYVDAIATQPDFSAEFHRSYFEGLYKKYKKPIYIADYVTSYRTDEHPVTMGQIAQDAKSYVRLYEAYILEAFSLPFVIGLNKCQYQDELRPTLLKQGLVRQDGTFYPTVEGVRAANLKAMKIAYHLP